MKYPDRLAMIKKLSLCFRCGSKGHRAKNCRNAVTCFRCGKLGHKSFFCSLKNPSPKPSSPPQEALKTSIQSATSPILSTMETPIHHILLGDTAFDQFHRDLLTSIIVTTPTGLDSISLHARLRISYPEVPKEQWKISCLMFNKFLIGGPADWFKKVMRVGFLELGMIKLQASTNFSELFQKIRSETLWIRILNLPYDMRAVATLQYLVSFFGVMADWDENTARGTDLRWARVKVLLQMRSRGKIAVGGQTVQGEGIKLEMNCGPKELSIGPTKDLGLCKKQVGLTDSKVKVSSGTDYTKAHKEGGRS